MKLYYKKGVYEADNSTAIQTFTENEEFGFLEPYGNATVCLAGYGMTPPEGYIFIPVYKMTWFFYQQVVKDIVEEVVMSVKAGYGDAVLAKLKPHWEDNVTMCE